MAGRLYDWLVARFGQHRGFMDVDSIHPGQDFAETIEQAVGACNVLLALIGPQWLTMTDEGRRRLDDPDDLVRLEIEAALERKVRVIPVLVEGASMPRARDLPDSLAKLTRRQAFGIRHDRFRTDVSQLVTAIEAGFYGAFWDRFLQRVQAEHPDWIATRISQTDNGITMPSGKSGAVYRCSFAADGKPCTELYIDRGDADANVALFRALQAQKQGIEEAYDKTLSWDEVAERGASCIADYADGDGTNTDQYDEYNEWFLKTVTRLRDALADYWPSNGPVLVERPEAIHVLHHIVKVRAVAFSPDGRLLATAGRDGTAWVWELATGEEQRRLEHASFVSDVAFSPDGQLLATASEDTARVWELATEQQPRSFSVKLAHFEPMVRVAFSPDSRLLATASHDHTARVWELATGQEQTEIIHARAVFCVAFSPPDGRLMATGSSDGMARVTELATGHQRSLPHGRGNTVRDVAFSPDGRLLATASHDGTAWVWELATGRQQAMVTHNNYNQPVVSVAFSPNGQLLATASDDRTAKVWALIR